MKQIAFLGFLWLAANWGLAAEVKVTPAQMQRLGIQLGRPEKVADLPLGVVPGVVTVPPRNRYLVTAPLGALVRQVRVACGDRVDAGQALLVLDSPELLRQQRRLLDTWQALRVAEARYQREKPLYRNGIIPKGRWLETERGWH